MAGWDGNIQLSGLPLRMKDKQVRPSLLGSLSIFMQGDWTRDVFQPFSATLTLFLGCRFTLFLSPSPCGTIKDSNLEFLGCR